MLTIKNRVMATAALLAVAASSFLLTPAVEAAVVSTITLKQSVSGNLIADRYDNDYEYSERHGRYLNRGRHRRSYNSRYYNKRYQSIYSQPPVVIYNKPVGLYAPQVIYAPQERRCVRTLYSTICN
jgi:hypothetical protein